ncbi:hypothetical protein [Haloplanus salinus]|uniref:hypothetical protein n=1 Tax=Haloplanus salinus TaxID=1126245 RepID=UPI0011C07D32|nr:hypothetical protein [Haloplanus salinus]
MPHWRANDWSLPRPSVVVGFLLLAVPPLALFGVGVWGTLLPRGHVVLSPILAAGTLAVGAGIRCEWWELRRVIRDGAVVVDGARWNLVAVAGGTLLTVAGATELGLSPIVSASLVGVGAAVVVQRVAVPVYCGAFVGMTSPEVFGSYWQVTLAAVLAGLLFTAAHPVFHGLGGKLGTTAFVGVSLVAVPTAGSFQRGALPGESAVVSVVGVAALGAVVTFAIHTRAAASPVLASGVVGAVGGVLLPLVFGHSGRLFAAATYSASFAGMTDPRRIPNEWWLGVTGVGVGLVVVYTLPFVGGSGGKLGTIAFGASLGIHGTLRLVDLFQLVRRGYRAPAEETT